MSQGEVDRTVEILGHGSTGRLMRSAESYPFAGGTKLGVELTLVPASSITTFGDEQGSVPSLIPAPRIFFAKGLFFDVEFILNFMTSGLYDTLSTKGFLLKWTFAREKEKWMSTAIYAGYTKVTGFSSSYLGSNLEAGMVASKDYVKLRPYAGLGILLARGSVSRELVKASADNSALQSTLHGFVGAEIQNPIDMAFQIDFMNLSLRAALFLGKRF